MAVETATIVVTRSVAVDLVGALKSAGHLAPGAVGVLSELQRLFTCRCPKGMRYHAVNCAPHPGELQSSR